MLSAKAEDDSNANSQAQNLIADFLNSGIKINSQQ